MTEQLQNLVLTNEQLADVANIAREAFKTVDTQYGTGFPHFVAGVHNLSYHNGHHARTVPEDAVKVGKTLGFTAPELLTVHAAGSAHDIVQLKPRGQMEAESAEWIVEQMRRRRLPGVMAEAGSLAILGTEPIVENNKLVGQVATRLEYPSRSAERVSLSVACGDFGRMLTPIGPYLGHKLYQQIQGVNPGEDPPMEDLARYLAGQAALRQDYRFPLPEAEPILATHRREVIAYGETILRLVERGDISSWSQLEAMDLAFMRDPSRYQ